MANTTQELLLKLRLEADQALRDLKRVENQTKATSSEFVKVGKSGRNFGNQFQNIGYQVQDFAVQVSGGTDAMRAFSQQAPQLLSPLGSIGIAAATAVAVLAPLAKVLFENADAADDAVDSFGKFKAKLSAIGTSNSGPIAELTKALENADKVTRAYIISLLELEKIKLGSGLAAAQQEVDKYVASLTKYTDVIGVSIDGIAVGVGKLTGDAAKLEGIKENLKVDKETAQSVLQLINAYDGTAEAAKILATELNKLAAAGKIDPEVLGSFEQLVETLDNLSGSLASTAPKLEEVTVSAKKLSDTAPDMSKWEDFGNTVKDSIEPARVYYRELEKLRTAADLGVIEVEDLTRAVGELQDKFLQPIEVPVRKLKKPLEETQTLVEQIKEATKGWADTFANDVVAGLENGKLAFKDFADYVLKQLARIALSKAFEPLFNSFGGWLDGIFPSAAPAGLTATPASNMPLSREMATVQPMVVGVPRMSAPVKSNSPVTVNVINQGSNEVEVNERKTTRGVEIDVLIKNAVKKGIAAGDFDKVMATSYGARRLAF